MKKNRNLIMSSTSTRGFLVKTRSSFSLKRGRSRIIGCLAGFCMLGAMTGCGKKEESVSTDLIIKEYAKGLDLKLVGDLARKSKNAADFEKQLNTTSNKINNLDLNDDGKVDYIKVTEYGKGNKRGFSLTTDVGKGKEQEIATIEFVKSVEKVDMYVNGN